MVPGSGMMTPDAYAERVATTVIVVVSDLGEKIAEMPLDDFKHDLRTRIAEVDDIRKQAHDDWVDQFGSEIQFSERVRELRKNPTTKATKPGDHLLFKFIENYDAGDHLDLAKPGVPHNRGTPSPRPRTRPAHRHRQRDQPTPHHRRGTLWVR